MKIRRISRLFTFGALLVASAFQASAGQRSFAYSYETTTSPKGAVEFENWVTWKQYRSGNDKNVFDFRHELEFGVTDRLQIGIYMVDWRYTDSGPGKGATYQTSGIEVIYNLTNPTTDLLGTALYGEILVGDDVLKLEGKLLLQKKVAKFNIAYNAVIEAEWEGSGLDEQTGEFKQTLGAAYELSPKLSLGVELFYELEMPDWSASEDGVFYAGPNASFHFGRYFATLAYLFQLTDEDSESDAQVRLIFGMDF